MKDPVNPRLNAAVVTLARRLFPLGFDVLDTSPSTLEDLVASVKETGRFPVWSGASDDTIYADREINYAFRAWHDWCHWRYALPFNAEGEREAAYVQVAHLVRLYGGEDDVIAMAALVLCEVIGQAEAYGSHGKFPDSQRAFTEANAWRWKPLAEALVKHFERTTATDRDAIRKARSTAKALAPMARAA